MKILLDDGSTAIKMQWEEGKEVKRFVSINSFRHGHMASAGRTKADNYVCNGDSYTFDPTANGINTTNINYQYGDVNAVAVHHALHNSGITPQPVDLVVTLPLSEYYTADFQANMTNINRKIDNLRKPVECLKRSPFIFNTIDVVPESMPAAYHALDDLPVTHSLLVVDLGGTTLDVCMIAEKGARMVQTYGDSQLGVGLLTNEVRSWMSANGVEASPVALDRIIRNRHDVELLEDEMIREGYGQQLQATILKAQQTLAQRVLSAIGRFTGYHHVLMVGGGAPLVAAAVQQGINFPSNRFTIASDPQFALVDGIYWMTK